METNARTVELRPLRGGNAEWSFAQPAETLAVTAFFGVSAASFTQALNAALTLTTTVGARARVELVGTLTLTSELVRRARLALIGVLTTAGGLNRKTALSVVAVLTFSGAVVAVVKSAISLAAGLSLAGVLSTLFIPGGGAGDLLRLFKSRDV